jgi:hypothetical protein
MGREDGGGEKLLEWLEGLRGLDLTDAEVKAAAERLLADRKTALPILLAQFADPREDPALLAVATVTLKAWGAPYPIKPLTALLQSRDVGALGKALLMKVLDRYGLDVDGKDLVGLGINLEEFEIESGPGPAEASRN